jgi:hypothetical protein
MSVDFTKSSAHQCEVFLESPFANIPKLALIGKIETLL